MHHASGSEKSVQGLTRAPYIMQIPKSEYHKFELLAIPQDILG